ncbi:hypothetical protein Q4555_00030 [Octadecabacter sp. 1_MG-2023]|uniref:hypothetical protein n=1 Tax=unclassified Octadecabacter TaxID=196158 RepID=UPI001C0A2E6A|nr:MULTISPECIES: hypothetical protein [unclassified Octadecabacter]MBU2993510.1 hypothetical protein [Octadecabacter sp. B2R22]MDO6733034.1 hypothetical protein [Octadecabacter sp. 1_MG-2023]
MLFRLRSFIIVALVFMALVLPKLTATLTSILPGFTTVVLCTGSTIEHIILGPDGQPVSIEETDHQPCTTANPEPTEYPELATWVAMTRSYDASFVIITHPAPNQSPPHVRPLPQGPPVRLI